MMQGEHTQALQPRQRVFVLGTGRCGTQTLAALLSSIPRCNILHEISPPLLAEAAAYLDGSMSHDALVQLVRDTRSRAFAPDARFVGESNQRLSFILPVLAEAFPDARYIWLMRDGRDAVASMHARLWYHPRETSLRHPSLHDWETSRIRGDCVRAMDAKDWRSMTPFECCCWYWAYTNQLIDHQLRALQLPTFPLRIEQLDASLPALLSFLSIDDQPRTVLHVNRSSSPYARWWRRPLPSRDWSEFQRGGFARLAGKVMDELYPGWQSQCDRSPTRRIRAGATRGVRHALSIAADLSEPIRAAGTARRGG